LARERVFGRFYKKISIPEYGDATKVSATMDHAVLMISVPIVHKEVEGAVVPIKTEATVQKVKLNRL
jgi:HSP20 family molecular chaperone IbpA